MIDWEEYPLPERFRHHVSSNLYIPLNELKIKPSNYPPVYDNIDWSKHFGNRKAPDKLDIGCGFGHFMMELALQKPDENILGIEVRKQAVKYAEDVIEKEMIGNCSVIWYSVVNGLDFLEEESIKQIYYFFPDPWFKKKHKKRRAFDEDFLNFCFRVLEKEGELLLQTDVEEVHSYHLEILDNFKKFNYKELSSDDTWDLPKTNKEKDCIKKDIPYYRIRAVKNV